MMLEEILIENVKFWEDQNIIYCKIYEDFDAQYTNEQIERIFTESIDLLSSGSHLPILFNFRELNTSTSIKLFSFINKSTVIRNNSLSTTYLVNNFGLKLLFSSYATFSNSILPITIFNKAELKVQFCHHTHRFLLRQE